MALDPGSSKDIRCSSSRRASILVEVRKEEGEASTEGPAFLWSLVFEVDRRMRARMPPLARAAAARAALVAAAAAASVPAPAERSRVRGLPQVGQVQAPAMVKRWDIVLVSMYFQAGLIRNATE
jgi:hypothetical protein